jgi:hypothetical protein
MNGAFAEMNWLLCAFPKSRILPAMPSANEKEGSIDFGSLKGSVNKYLVNQPCLMSRRHILTLKT